MSKKTIQKNLIKALLDDGEMTYALFEHELEEHIKDFMKSKKKDKDEKSGEKKLEEELGK